MSKASINFKSLPSPKRRHFFLGHLPEFRATEEHLALEKWVQECGDLVKLNFAGQNFLLSADPLINSHLLKLRPGQFKRLSAVDTVLREMGVDGVFNAEGESWVRHRTPISDALSPRRLDGYYPTVRTKAAQLVAKLTRLADGERPVDIKKELMSFAIDTTAQISFGCDLNTIEDEEHVFHEHLDVVFATASERISAPIPIWRYVKRKRDRAFERSLCAVKDTIFDFIHRAKKRLESDARNSEAPANLLEVLLSGQAESNFSEEEIYGNVFVMLLAGEETTSNTLSWALYYLIQHPEIVLRVREEALSAYSTTVPQDRESLSALPQASAVVQEALRLKPTIPQLYLEANEDITVERLDIPRGTKIIVQSGLAQKDDAYFSRAEAFEPERWLRANNSPDGSTHTPAVLRAFGGGPRFCPGMKLALEEMTCVISSLCKTFDFEPHGNIEDIGEKFVFTLAPDNFLLKLRRVQCEETSSTR